MADLSELIERVEKLTGPDREVDRDVLRVAGTHILEKRGKDRKAWWYPVDDSVAKYSNEGGFGCPPPFPHFTASLDAAVALVERVLPGCGLSVEHHPVYGDWWDATIFDRMPMTIANARKQTAALAVCLATLRALQDQEDRDG